MRCRRIRYFKWCSDNTDAIDRLKIQRGTSYGYPVSAMGSHISAVPNHQTGRSVPLQTRGIVAKPGTFGYELDPGTLDEKEKQEISETHNKTNVAINVGVNVVTNEEKIIALLRLDGSILKRKVVRKYSFF